MHSSLLSAFSNPKLRCAAALIAVALVAAGCASRRPAPVEDRGAAPPPAAASVARPAPAPAVAPSAPVPTYTVKRGDTLHQIALDSGLDYRELAACNNIEIANVIRVGQVLRLTAPGTAADPNAPVAAQEVAPGVTTAPLRAPPSVVATAPPTGAASPAAAAPATSSAAAPSAANASNLKTSPKAIKQPYSDQAVRELTLAASAVPAPREPPPMAAAAGPRPEPKAEPKSEPKAEPKSEAKPASPAPATGGDGDQLDWAWPAKGKVVAGFSETANLKGIDIAGTAGQPVAASAAGRVVYAGTGLRGYGKLIIIKHNATFLSAYAHTREILVKEGQQVARGQKIAEMGNTDADQVKLHFEIRRQGKPMDPAKYLPPA
jgi:lipoprotein NlpD